MMDENFKAGDQAPVTEYAVLLDTGSDWPDVIFVGTRDDAIAFEQGLSGKHRTSLQAIVTVDDALAHGQEGADS